MRYLTVVADYTQSPLRDDYIGTVVPEEIGLSWELGAQLRDWNDRYRAIIPIDLTDRTSGPASDLINELDDEGLKLADAISSILQDVKVRYYSEGRLRYLSPEDRKHAEDE